MHVGVAELTGDSLPMEGPVLATAKQFRFGDFEFHTSPARLSSSGVPIKVRPQALQVLELLLSRAGEMVTREEIRYQLWGDSAYLDHERGINSALLHLRKALNDDPHSPEFIETVPRHGYRFIAPVELSETPLVSVRTTAQDEDCPPPRRWPKVVAIAGALAAVVGISVLSGRFMDTPPAAPELPRVMIQPMEESVETGDTRPSATSLTDTLVRILVTDYSDRLDLAAGSAAGASETQATPVSVSTADYEVQTSLTFDEHSDYAITLKLVRSEERTIVWADTKHLAADQLASWPELAAADLVNALAILPTR
jgi:DNA-binding winged helix-turn-helix (wHTH) protein